jgi:CheY-like chemotaxis protein
MSEFTDFAKIDNLKLEAHGEQFTENQKNKFAGKRILVAEDSIDLQQLVKSIFDPLDIEIEFAENGEVALEKVAGGNFDIILMDIQMPVMGGVETTQRLRKAKCKTPIIAVTANILKEEEEKIMQAGCNDYLLKPYNLNSLIGKIEKYLDFKIN